MMSTFAQIKLNVVWRDFRKLEDIPDNVKIVPWLPQNDLLGHPNTRLFITHCGVNGQHEAIYHGVPMIGFPIFSEQMYNCKRLPYR